MRSRTVAFALLAGVCVVAAIVSAAVAVVGASQDRKEADRAVSKQRPSAVRVISAGEPFVVFRTLDRKHAGTYGRMAVAPLSGDGQNVGERALAGPACRRLAFDARGGVCLDAGTEMSVSFVDANLKLVKQEYLPGIPSRVRLSPDGRWAGITAFITGHAYAQPGEFSTAATIVDRKTGTVYGDLEKDFKITNDGKAIDARDRNYWGLTFAKDGDTFYATVAYSGRTWLIQGSVSERRAHTIHENVECPSISPDGTRIAYKKAISTNPSMWRFHVLDLASGQETQLSETRSIDDQLEWLDDDHLLYQQGETTWMMAADGSGKPRQWVRAADSPAIVRPAAD